MTYYRDLTPYVYSASLIPDLNVGWLGWGHRVRRASVPEGFVEALERHVIIPRNQSRGFHDCPFCGFLKRGHGICVNTSKGLMRLGSAEIHVFSRDGECFASPDLIYHYVERHGYCPPSDYIEAVMGEPLEEMDEKVLRKLQSIARTAQSVGDRVDAVMDLLVFSPELARSLMAELVEDPDCHPYVRKKFE